MLTIIELTTVAGITCGKKLDFEQRYHHFVGIVLSVVNMA
jgi:hypothetical protein